MPHPGMGSPAFSYTGSPCSPRVFFSSLPMPKSEVRANLELVRRHRRGKRRFRLSILEFVAHVVDRKWAILTMTVSILQNSRPLI